jgi:hypothetical protein
MAVSLKSHRPAPDDHHDEKSGDQNWLIAALNKSFQ